LIAARRKKPTTGRSGAYSSSTATVATFPDEFLNYCLIRKIFVTVFPPHSIHTLQPLDVVCFKPLSTAYSKKLSEHTQRSQGLVPIKKGDFFLLFLDAWQESFLKRTIQRSLLLPGYAMKYVRRNFMSVPDELFLLQTRLQGRLDIDHSTTDPTV
jgi:hypothetical protein